MAIVNGTSCTSITMMEWGESQLMLSMLHIFITPARWVAIVTYKYESMITIRNLTKMISHAKTPSV